MSNTPKTISNKKSNELYGTVMNSITDARIEIKLYCEKNNLSKHYDVMDKILFNCELKTAQKAIEIFNKNTKEKK